MPANGFASAKLQAKPHLTPARSFRDVRSPGSSTGAVTDGLDGFCPAPDNPAASKDDPHAQMKLAVRRAARLFCLPRQPTGAGPAVAGAKARAPWRRRERPG